MTEQELRDDEIARYLDKAMSKEELAAFRIKMAQDVELAQEVKEFEFLTEAIAYSKEESFRQDLRDAIDKSWDTPVVPMYRQGKFWRRIAVASLAIALIIWAYQATQTPKLDSNLALDDPANKAPIIQTLTLPVQGSEGRGYTPLQSIDSLKVVIKRAGYPEVRYRLSDSLELFVPEGIEWSEIKIRVSDDTYFLTLDQIEKGIFTDYQQPRPF